MPRHASHSRQQFGDQAFGAQVIPGEGVTGFTEQLHCKPEQLAAAEIIARNVQGCGAVPETFLPSWPDLDIKEPDTAWADFVLVWDAGRSKLNGKWAEVVLLAAIAFRVVAFENDCEEWEFMRVRRHFARGPMTQVSEDYTALFLPGVNCAIKAASP